MPQPRQFGNMYWEERPGILTGVLARCLQQTGGAHHLFFENDRLIGIHSIGFKKGFTVN